MQLESKVRIEIAWHLLVQGHRRGERRYWPQLPHTKLACNSMWQVILNSIETDKGAPHPVEGLVYAAQCAELNVHHLLLGIRLPLNLHSNNLLVRYRTNK